MKILFVSDLWLPFPGGAERFVFNIARELRKRGHEIHVLTSYAAAKAFDGLVPTFKEIGVNDRHALGAQVVDEHVRALHPDLIVTHHFFAYEFERELFDYPLPVVQIVHSRHRVERAALAVFNSEFTAGRFGRRDGDLVIAPPAYDDVVAPSHGDFIGFVKPIPHKGAAFFYKVASQMPERRFLVLRGEWQPLETIRTLPNVTFMDPVDDIREFYARCRLTLVPSLSEDAGTVPQESARNGIPCISSDLMGLRETNGGGVRLPHEVRLWVKAIRTLDRADVYAQVVERQRAHLQRFAWDEKFDALDRAIRHAKFVRRYESYNCIGREFLATYPTQRDRETFLLDHAVGRVLDFGCNDCGLWERHPNRADVWGIDLSHDAVRAAVARGFSVRQGRAEASGHPDKSFDTVAISELIEHVEDPHALLAEASRVARRQIIGTVPRPTGGWGAWKFDPDHVQFWERDALHALLARWGEADVRELNADFFAFVVRLPA